MINYVEIDKYRIGAGYPCFIIAEAGVNHNGDMNTAHRLIDAAVKAGADAIKFQSYVTEDLITFDAPKADYQVETTGANSSQYEMLKALELSAKQQMELKDHCDEANILYLCTPYETSSADLLERMNVSAFKVASTDTTNIPFLRYLARKGRPAIVSTGLSTLGEVEQAVNTLRQEGLTDKFVLLHCTAAYPAPIHEVNLRAIQTMQQAFQCPVGFSDHTTGIGASPWAVALGACVIEKHFTLDRNLPGPDHRVSLEPDTFRQLIKTIRDLEAALGDGIKCPTNSELPNKPKMQKSLVAAHQISKGQVIKETDLTCKRPGEGLPPIWFDRIVGRLAKIDVAKDSLLLLSSVDWES
jgi:N-acetylneuraminate synthase